MQSRLTDGRLAPAGMNPWYAVGAILLLAGSMTPRLAGELHDWNDDGLVSIIGDVPPFVQGVYFNNYPSGVDVLAVGDCNRDGILSIIGDVPCFVQCVYFGNCSILAGPPTGLSAVPGDGQILLNWDEVNGALGYNIYWNTTGHVTLSDNRISVLGPPYYHTGMALGTTCYYIVTAANSTTETEPSNEVSSTAHMVIKPGDILAATHSQGLHRIDPITGKESYIGSVRAPIAVDSQGHVLNGYEILDPETGARSTLCAGGASSTIGDVTGIAVDERDNIFVTTARGESWNPQHYLGRIDAATQTYTDIVDIAIGLYNVSGLAIDANGDVIVVGVLRMSGGPRTNDLRVMRINPQTGAQTRIDFDPGLFPSAIAVGPDGYFYISLGESDPVLRVDPSTGQYTAVRTVRRATALAFDANGDLLIADFGSKYGAGSYLIRVDLETGTSSTLAQGIRTPDDGAYGRFVSIAVVR